MEVVDAELHGWPAAPFGSKAETDANYKRMLDVVLDPDNDGAVRAGIASHNLFEVAWAVTQADLRGARHRVEIEMLEGMAPAVAEATAARFGGLLLYAPIVARGDIESAIAYLVRRLDENSGPDNFLTHSFSLTAGSPVWEAEADRFRRSVADRAPAGRPRPAGSRTGPRTRTGPAPVRCSRNEPDTDFSIAANREWIRGHLDGLMARLRSIAPSWPAQTPPGPATEAGIDPSAPEGGPAYRWLAGLAGGGGAGGGVPPGRPDRAGRHDPRLARRAGARGRGRRAGPAARRAAGRHGLRRRQDGAGGGPRGLGGHRLRRLLRRPHPRRRLRLSPLRHGGGGFAVELPPVHPGRRRARPPWRPGTR